MLELVFGGTEGYNNETKEFTVVGGTRVKLEHSLVSVSKWESLFEKPFLGAGEIKSEEVLTYVKMCVIDPNVSPEVFLDLTSEHLDQFNEYLGRSQTATRFNKIGTPTPARREEVTSEMIYYWMIGYQIPFECQHWFLGRLLTLIELCQIKAEESKTGKKSRKIKSSEFAQAALSRSELNRQRRELYNTSG